MSDLMQDVYNLNTELKYPSHYSEDSKLKLRELSKSFMLMDGAFMYHFEDTSTLTKNNTPLVRFREVVLDKRTRVKKIRAIHISGGKAGKHKNKHEVQQILLEKYHWDGIDDDVKQVVESCETCINRKSIRKRQRLDKRMNDCGFELHPNELNLMNSLTENNGMEMESSSESSDSVVTDVQEHEIWDKVEVKILGPYSGYYVAVFVDVFSTWTEAFVMANSEIASLVTAIFTVICRRGVMKQILFRGSESESSQLETVLKLFSREDCDCPVQVQHKASSSLDTQWKDLKTSLGDFVRASPHDWFQYIEFFLLPFRASRAEHKDNTASYLFSSREMRLPASISHQKSEHRELHLTETQIQESIKTFQDLFYKTLTECEEVEREALLMENRKEIVSRKRKNEMPTTKEPPPPKKLKADNVKEEVGSYMYDYTNYSMVVLGYLQGKGFPPNFSSGRPRASVISNAAKYELKEGRLYLRIHNRTREVLVDEEDRFKVMVKAHFTKYGHLPHNNSTNTCTIISCKYYWHGMNSDIKAFLKACPRCRETDPNLSEEEDASITQSQGGKISIKVKLEDSTNDFKQIVAFLKRRQDPSKRFRKNHAKPKQLDMFCLEEDDSLYCVNSDEKKRRKVIMTPEEKKACLEEAHVTITGKHRSKEFTHSYIIKQYYWPRMCSEIDKYVKMCRVCRNNRCIQIMKSQQEAKYFQESGIQETMPHDEQETMTNYMEEVTISDIYTDTADDIQSVLPPDVEWTTPIESKETMPINILQDTPRNSDNHESMVPSDNQESTPSDNQESIHGENKEANLSGNQESTSNDNQKVTVRDTQEAQPNTPLSKHILGLKETEGKSANKKQIHLSKYTYTERLKNEDRIEKYKAMFAQKRDSLDLMIYDHEYSSLKTTPEQLFLNASAENKGEPSLSLTDHKCIYCKSIFTEFKDLKKHMDYHIRDKRYLCELCGLAISAKTITSHRFKCQISLDSLKNVGRVQMPNKLKSLSVHSKKISNRKKAISQDFVTLTKKSTTKIPAIQPMFNETKITHPHSTAKNLKNTITANQFLVKNIANQMSKKTKPQITQPSSSTQKIETTLQDLLKMTRVPGQLNTAGQMSQLQLVYKNLTAQMSQKQPTKKRTDAPKMQSILYSDPSSTVVKVKTNTPATQQNPLPTVKESPVKVVITITPATQQNPPPRGKVSPVEVKRNTAATQQNPPPRGKVSPEEVITITPATQQNPLSTVKESSVEVITITPATQQNPPPRGKVSPVEVKRNTPATQQNPLSTVKEPSVEVITITPATQQNPLLMEKESTVEVKTNSPSTQQNPLPIVQSSSKQNVDTS